MVREYPSSVGGSRLVGVILLECRKAAITITIYIRKPSRQCASLALLQNGAPIPGRVPRYCRLRRSNRIRSTTDERTYRQEFEASFETYSGVVIYAFVREHSVRSYSRRDGVMLHVGMDFNVNPMSATVWQENGEVTHQVGEVVIQTSDTDEMANELIRRYGPAGGMTIYPDPAGAARHTSAQGRTDSRYCGDMGLMFMHSQLILSCAIGLTSLILAFALLVAYVVLSLILACRKSHRSIRKADVPRGNVGAG